MRKHFHFALRSLLILAGLFLFAHQAEAQTITVENNTGAGLAKLFISNAETNSWDGSVLKGRVLAPGESFEVTFNGKFAIYDLLAIFDNGREQPYYGINVRQFSYIRLNTNGVETHQ